VLVGLILGIIVVGGVMGMISVSLQFSHRVKQKSLDRTVLEAAAQDVLAHPEMVAEGSLTLNELPDTPTVDIRLMGVEGFDDFEKESGLGDLYRVLLSYRGTVFELSIIVPKPKT
jgi:hypothetical protein